MVPVFKNVWMTLATSSAELWTFPVSICGAASKGDNLVGIANCARENCGRLDVSTYLGPLQLGCSVSGYSIPSNIVSSALSVYSQTTSLATVISPSTSPSTTRASNTPMPSGMTISAYSTATTTMTDSSGSSYIVVIPLVSSVMLNVSTAAPSTVGILTTNANGSTITSMSTATATSVTTTSSATTVTQSSTSTTASTASTAASGQPSGSGGSPFQLGTAVRNQGDSLAMAMVIGIAVYLL
ncbi:MAG: hypothetical protein M1814_003652 [Vezdaea aestivalis]|nr:MAG: hypothetical protein M1814_003652 [Vezdaea aestivalis]